MRYQQLNKKQNPVIPYPYSRQPWMVDIKHGEVQKEKREKKKGV
jgi:hypothetical protein